MGGGGPPPAARREPARLARGPRSRAHLIGAIDDATGKAVAATVFREQEDAAGYLDDPARHDRGLTGCRARSTGTATGTFARRTRARAPRAERRTGIAEPGRTGLVELGIDSIVAGSPQAKGRIERLWGTFQDRLVTELRLAGVDDHRRRERLPALDFLAALQRALRGPAADPVPAWRALPRRDRARAGARVQVPPQGREGPHDAARRAGPPAAPRGDWLGSNYSGKLVEVHVRLNLHGGAPAADTIDRVPPA